MLCLVSVVGSLVGLLYATTRAARLAELDGQLAAAGSALQAALRLFPPPELTGELRPRLPGRPAPPFERLYAALDQAGSAEPLGGYYAVWRADGRRLRAVNVPAERLAPPAPAQPVTQTLDDHREWWATGPEGTIIVVGQSIHPFAAEMHTLAVRLVGIALAVLFVGGWGSWLIARQIVQPLAHIAATAEQVSATTLSARIDTQPLAAELVGLAEVLNATFARLEAAFARQTRFTADAAHELRTPLTILRAQAELALLRPRTPAEFQAALTTCIQAATRLTDLVEQLLTLARAEAGWPDVARAPLDLVSVVREVLAQHAELATAARVSVAAHLHPAQVSGNAAALAQVVSNLLANAVKYNRPGGRVEVRLETTVVDVQLLVRDTGAGIAADEVPLVFERFFRADKARSRSTGGTGLGLAICHAIVTAHGGTLTCTSLLDEGSTFCVRLPLAPTAVCETI
jgi:heavy metal sensor kinase